MSDFTAVVDLIYSIRNKDVLENFLLGLTTEKERDAFARRLEIIKRLIAGEPHAKMAADLGVGVATITRGSKELAHGAFAVLGSPR